MSSIWIPYCTASRAIKTYPLVEVAATIFLDQKNARRSKRKKKWSLDFQEPVCGPTTRIPDEFSRRIPQKYALTQEKQNKKRWQKDEFWILLTSLFITALEAYFFLPKDLIISIIRLWVFMMVSIIPFHWRRLVLRVRLRDVFSFLPNLRRDLLLDLLARRLSRLARRPNLRRVLASRFSAFFTALVLFLPVRLSLRPVRRRLLDSKKKQK